MKKYQCFYFHNLKLDSTWVLMEVLVKQQDRFLITIVSYDNCKLKIQTKVLFRCPDIGKIQQQCVWGFFSLGIAFEWKMATIMSKNELLVLVTINVDCYRILRSVHVFN